MKDEGGPAFPIDVKEDRPHYGMSLRDYFAAAALSGLCASGKGIFLNGCVMSTDKAAYVIADAMLKERNK